MPLFFLVFIVWQVTVLGSVAYGIIKPQLRSIKLPIQLLTRKQAIALTAALIVSLGVGVYADDDALYSVGQRDGMNLEKYLAACILCVHRDEANQELATINKEASEHQAAHGSTFLLGRYINSCRVCTYISEASQEIASIEERQRTDAIRDDQQQFQNAHGDLGRLQTYVSLCKACAHADEARSEIDLIIGRQKLAQQEAVQYRSALGNISMLRAYVITCRLCEYRFAANSEITRLENEARYFVFQVCNKTSYLASVSILGRLNADNVDWTLEGWWNIYGGSCQNFGKFVKGNIYAMATVNGETLGWRGNDTNQCVSGTPFKRVIAQTACSGNEWREGFTLISVNEASYVWNIEGPPKESDDFFTFEVCNNSGRFVAVAVSGVAVRGGGFITEGWKHAPPGVCSTIGKYLRGNFYAMAEELGALCSNGGTQT